MSKPARRAKAPVLKLVPQARSQDAVDTLRGLLWEAERGEIIGLAYVVIRPGDQSYACSVVGEARRRATFTRGALRVLDEELGKIIRG